MVLHCAEVLSGVHGASLCRDTFRCAWCFTVQTYFQVCMVLHCADIISDLHGAHRAEANNVLSICSIMDWSMFL